MKRGKDTIDNLVLMENHWGRLKSEGKLVIRIRKKNTLKYKITCSGRYLKLKIFFPGKSLLVGILCNVAWRGHVQ